ncbi:MAG: hypothetical protein VKK94_03420 [Cyanobacteriota bacterium]|nr:hypothetical protein [Cyanobacteriota bacterium]
MAVGQRNREQAARLGQHWVHRRGLDDLEIFVAQELSPTQGDQAASWFLTQLGLAEPSSDRIEFISTKAHAEVPIPAPSEPRQWQASTTQSSSALFNRMKALLRQRLEEAILGLENEAPGAEAVDLPAPRLAPAPPLQTRLRAVSPGSPAPVPPALADLRAWLPEDHADLPRAS